MTKSLIEQLEDKIIRAESGDYRAGLCDALTIVRQHESNPESLEVGDIVTIASPKRGWRKWLALLTKQPANAIVSYNVEQVRVVHHE
jgi:hypothetical protein